VRSNSKAALALAICYSATAAPAFAYLDGATGSMILQAVIAGAATILVFWRSQLMRLKMLFSRLFKQKSPEAE
jgi:hypothetical protein